MKTIAVILAGAALACSAPALAAKQPMVAAAHPVAAEAGAEILRAGGNAVDAAVAVSLTLGVVEPHASGLGGGGFMLVYDASTRTIDSIDFRERAPRGYDLALVSTDGVLDSRKGGSGALSVGVPSLLLGLAEAHERHGRLPWADLVQPAIRAAEDGFPVYPFLASSMASSLDKLSEDEASAEAFLMDGIFPYEEGDILRQPDLAATLRWVAARGPAAIYEGEGAERIAAAVQAAGGVLAVDDLAAARTYPLPVLRGPYHGFEIVAPGAPSAGGVKILATLGLLDSTPASHWARDRRDWFVSFSAASAETTALADAMVADAAFVPDRTSALLSPLWQASTQHRLLAPEDLRAAIGTAAPKADLGRTTHFSILDSSGNMVSNTQTINYFFGSGITVPGMGILLNNQLADFTFEAGHPNEPAAGKVPRSNMAPLLVLRDGAPAGALGSPGGPRIPQALAQIIANLVDLEMELDEALEAPRLFVDPRLRRVSFEAPLGREHAEAAAARLEALSRTTWRVAERSALDSFFGGAQVIWTDDDGTQGAADPRRAGAVARP